MLRRTVSSPSAVLPASQPASKEELHAYWKRLHLKSETQLHLQEVLDTTDLVAAAAITDIVAEEKQPRFANVSKEWGWQELRLMLLDWFRPHLVNGIRLLLEALLAWHLLSVSDALLDQAVEVGAALLFLLVGAIAVYFTCRARRITRDTHRPSSSSRTPVRRAQV